MIAFINSVLSYLLVMVVISVLAFAGLKIGIALRKSKNAKEAILAQAEAVEKTDK